MRGEARRDGGFSRRGEKAVALVADGLGVLYRGDCVAQEAQPQAETWKMRQPIDGRIKFG
ncbi:MAG: hypothetical protein ACLTMW_06630 [Blautia hydrogenotrophica]